jgi:hypothetical protein
MGDTGGPGTAVTGNALDMTRMVRTLTLAGLLSAAALAPAASQDFPRPASRPWIAEVSHWGKWVALAGAAGLITVAAVRHGEAQDALGLLEDFCRPENPACLIVTDANGAQRYEGAEAEELYQAYAVVEKRARGFLLGGQASLLASGAMFLIDLIHRTEDVDNIPYTPLELYTGPNRLGLALHF